MNLPTLGNWTLIERHRWSFVILMAALFAVLYALSLNPYLSTYGDNAKYILLARGLAEDGSFSVNLDGVPKLETKHPPGFPAILIPVDQISGGNVVAMKSLVAITLLCAVIVLYILFGSMVTPGQSVVLLLLLGFSRQLGRFANKVMAEAPFLLFLGSAMLAAQLYVEEKRWWSRSGWCAAGFLALSVFTRTVGAVPSAAIVAFLFFAHAKSNWKLGLAKAGFVAMVVGCTQLGWFLRNNLIAGTVSNYVGQFTPGSSDSPESILSILSSLIERFVDNVGYYLPEIARSLTSDRHSALLPSGMLEAVVTVVVLVGFVFCIKRRPSVIEWVFVSLFLVALLWPFQSTRFLFPFLPFLLYYLVNGAAAMVNGWGPFAASPVRWISLVIMLIVAARALSTNLVGRGQFEMWHWIALTVTLALATVVLRLAGKIEFSAAVSVVLAAAVILSSAVWHIQRNVIRSHAEPYYYEIGEGWGEYRDAANWLRDNVPESARVGCRKPYLMRLWSGRNIVKYKATADQARLLRGLSRTGVEYVIVDRFSRESKVYLKPVVESHDALFEEVGRIGETAVFRFDQTARGAPDPGGRRFRAAQ